TLAIALGAHHQAAPVILDGAGEDLRCRSAQAVDKDQQGAIVNGRSPRAIAPGYHLIGLAYLDYRAWIDKQIGHGGDFVEGATAIVAQVENDAVDSRRLELLHQFGDISGGTFVVGIPVVEGVKVNVEGGQIDNPNLDRLAVVVEVDNATFGRLLLQLHLVPHDAYHLVGARTLTLGGNDFEAHRAALGAADKIDDVLKAPADHVLYGLVVLAYPHHFILGRQNTLLARRTAGDYPHHAGGFIFHFEDGTNALELERHTDIEVFQLAGRVIAGMGVVEGGEGVHIVLVNVLGVGLLHPLELVAVA